MSFFAKIYARDGVVEFAQTSTDYLEHTMLPAYDADIISVMIDEPFLYASQLVPRARISGGVLVIDGVDGAKITSYP